TRLLAEAHETEIGHAGRSGRIGELVATPLEAHRRFGARQRGHRRKGLWSAILVVTKDAREWRKGYAARGILVQEVIGLLDLAAAGGAWKRLRRRIGVAGGTHLVYLLDRCFRWLGRQRHRRQFGGLRRPAHEGHGPNQEECADQTAGETATRWRHG